ncbi:MAG: hypothetical protein JWM64_1289 [Frankiales bacterium]|nr:hypothetical protein [Frankiales bacterium]
MRRPARAVPVRLGLAAVALAPLLLVAGCSGEDVPVRGENGSGVDSKASQAPGQNDDQTSNSSQ